MKSSRFALLSCACLMIGVGLSGCNPAEDVAKVRDTATSVENSATERIARADTAAAPLKAASTDAHAKLVAANAALASAKADADAYAKALSGMSPDDPARAAASKAYDDLVAKTNALAVQAATLNATTTSIDATLSAIDSTRSEDDAIRAAAHTAVDQANKALDAFTKANDPNSLFSPVLNLLPDPIRSPTTAVLVIGGLLLRSNRLAAAGRSIAASFENLKKAKPDLASILKAPDAAAILDAAQTPTAKRLVDEAQGSKATVPV